MSVLNKLDVSRSAGFQLKFGFLMILVGVIIKPAFASNVRIPKPQNPQYLIDTDAGPDDIMAISMLLNTKHITIEAITVVNGVAHVEKGAENIEKLLALSNHQNIPVYMGQTAPLHGHNAFPKIWRTSADQLPGVDLPNQFPSPKSIGAVEYLKKFLLSTNDKVDILALGPLTNIAKAIQQNPQIVKKIKKIIIMGGAFKVPGNVSKKISGGVHSEWNFYIDPIATNIVFESGVPITDIPLDATNDVPINKEFLKKFEALHHNALGRVVEQILKSQKDMIDHGEYYAWDPLAAASIIKPKVVKTKKVTVDTIINPPDAGRIYVTQYSPFKVNVAFSADKTMFRKLFYTAFRK